MRSERIARLTASVTGALICALMVLPAGAVGQDQLRSNPLRAPEPVTVPDGLARPAPTAKIASAPGAATQIRSAPDNSAAVAAALFHPSKGTGGTGPTVQATDAPAARPIRPFPTVTGQEALSQQLVEQSAGGTSPEAVLAQDLLEVPPQPYEPPEPLPPAQSQPAAPVLDDPSYVVNGHDTGGCNAAGCDGGCDGGCNGGCDGGCDGGCTECTSGCGSGPIWDVGTEFTFLSPNMNSAEVRYDVDDYFTPATHNFVVDHLDSVFTAPRLWVGVQGECWGIVGRFWRMTAGHAGHDPFFVPDGGSHGSGVNTGYVSNNIVDAYSIDLEVRRTFCLHDNKLYLGFGPRYAHFEHDQSVTAFALVDDDILTGHARSNRHAYGTGLLLAFGGRRPLFSNSCAHLFFNMRASILWGCTHADVQTSASLIDPTATAASFNGAAVSVNDDLFIGEIQLGMEWDYELKWLPANAFFRVAAEYQYWDASQGYAVSSSFADEAGVVDSTAFAEADGLRMNLIGLTIGTGLTW